MSYDHRLTAAAAFYCDPVTPLLRAIVQAEGGERAFIKAVQCSFPATQTFEEALARTCKTIRNRVIDFLQRDVGPLYRTAPAALRDPWTGEATPRRLVFTETFIEFLGARWAPIGADNDPTNLNKHWVPNVLTIYHGHPKSAQDAETA
jgi:hypothetical protein